MSEAPEWEIIKGVLSDTVDYYLALVGKDAKYVTERSRDVDYWAAVHKDHIGHESHAHENSLVSGVYYARVPSNSGRIVFEDPRGSLSPFGRLQTYFEPSEGDIVLFPSWLIHKVSPTPGTDMRLSIPFNVAGKWEDTTSIIRTLPPEAYAKLGK